MKRLLSGLSAGAFALALAACASTPVRYYTLASAAPPPLATQRADAPGRGRGTLQVEIGPVGVPDRLARPQMVLRSNLDPSSTRVSVLEQQRWSSPFDSELRDAFGVAIAARLGAVDVTRGGALPEQPVYRVALQLRQFDAVLDKQVEATFGWTITRSGDERNAVCQAFTSQPIGPGMDELVQGIQRVVDTLADRVATQIAQLQEGRTAACQGPGPRQAAR